MTTMTTLEKTAYEFLRQEYDSAVELEGSANAVLERLGHFAETYEEEDFFFLDEHHRGWIVESNAAVRRQVELAKVLHHFPDFQEELEWLRHLERHPDQQEE